MFIRKILQKLKERARYTLKILYKAQITRFPVSGVENNIRLNLSTVLVKIQFEILMKKEELVEAAHLGAEQAGRNNL